MVSHHGLLTARWSRSKDLLRAQDHALSTADWPLLAKSRTTSGYWSGNFRNRVLELLYYPKLRSAEIRMAMDEATGIGREWPGRLPGNILC